MSSKSFNRAEIIYTRLKDEYGNFESWDDFAEALGISRQAVNLRRKKEKVDLDGLLKAFPDINTEWLYSRDEATLKVLPVKNNFTDDQGHSRTNSSQVQEAIDSVNQVEVAQAAYLEGKRFADDPEKLLQLSQMLVDMYLKLVKR